MLACVAAPTLTELERAVRAAWSLWTADPADHHDSSGDDWSGDDPASGQCASTALIVHDTFGGTLLMAHVRRSDGRPAGYHYFNRLPDGTEIDLTAEQFHDGEVLFDVTEVEIPADRSAGRLPGPYHLMAVRGGSCPAAGRSAERSFPTPCAGSCARRPVWRSMSGGCSASGRWRRLRTGGSTSSPSPASSTTLPPRRWSARSTLKSASAIPDSCCPANSLTSIGS
jgi:hypothetical protein